MRAKIEVDVQSVVESIGAEAIINCFTAQQLVTFFGGYDPKDIGSLLRDSMSPEALAELKAALG